MLMQPDLQFVAFLRNVNLGQPGSPTRTQLESAFRAAGAGSARSFQTNGTLVFAARSLPVAQEITGRARQELGSACGLKEPAYLARLDHLTELVRSDPFAGREAPEVIYFAASFMPSGALARLPAPLVSPRGDLEVIVVTDQVALSVARRLGKTSGDPTSFIEKYLGVPVTTRSWGTIVRLVQKFAGQPPARR
jgi:uncharacterized protein (DUF1697 family)